VKDQEELQQGAQQVANERLTREWSSDGAMIPKPAPAPTSPDAFAAWMRRVDQALENSASKQAALAVNERMNELEKRINFVATQLDNHAQKLHAVSLSAVNAENRLDGKIDTLREYVHGFVPKAPLMAEEPSARSHTFTIDSMLGRITVITDRAHNWEDVARVLSGLGKTASWRNNKT
jgi:hypothetical protein